MAKASKLPVETPSLEDRVREICGYVVFAIAAFLLLACWTFVERDSADAAASFANRCGDTGYLVAKTTLHWFGYGVYLGIFTLILWGASLIRGRAIRVNPFRILWFGLFVFTASAFVSHLGITTVTTLPDPGGLVGRQIGDYVEHGLGFGGWGTKIVLLVAALIAFQLATDFILLRLILSAIEFLKRRQAQAQSAIETVGPLFSALMSKREEQAKRPSAPRAKAKSEIAVTDEEVEGFPIPTKGKAPKSKDPAVTDPVAGDATAKGKDKPKGKDPVDAKAEGGKADSVKPDSSKPETAKSDAAKADAAASEATKPEKGGKKSLAAVDPEEVVAAASVAANVDASKAPSEKASKKSGKIAEPKAEGDAALDAPKGKGPASRLPPGDDTEDPELDLPLDPPPILEDLPEAEVVPPPKADKKVAAKINLEPPKTKSHRSAGFENETTVFSAPVTVNKKDYKFPSVDLLEEPSPVDPKAFQKMIEGMAEILESALNSFKVDAEVVEIQKGPVITMFEINVAEGTRVDRIRALEDDLAIRLKVPSVRIVAPIPGKSTIGIEVPNRIRETVCLRELITAPEYDSANFAIPLFLGKDAAGRALIEDMAKAPHLLVAGATGAGKSVCLNSIIMSILFSRTPEQVKMILIDPKMVELSLFENIPHLACPVVRDMNRAAQILEWACAKMDERYEIMAEVGARNIFAYNKIADSVKREKLGVADDDENFEAKMPFIVIVVDELADLMMVSAKDVENHITRLAQKSRAVGIHIILATQRPSTNVITGLIKANLPTRISFQVASKIDSRVVLDQNGAEKLLGFGDMLYLPPRTSMLVRGQGAFVADEEIRKTVECIKVEQPMYSRELMSKGSTSEIDPHQVDELYAEAARFVCETKRGSASLLQRKFAIGYTRASRLIDLMADDGILGEYRNAQAREVLLTLDEFEDRERARNAAEEQGS